MRRSLRSKNLFTLAVAGLFLVVVCAPLGSALLRTITNAPLDGDFGSARQLKLLGTTIVVALATTLLATILGATVGITLDYFRAPFRRILWALTAVSFIVPSYAMTIAWIEIAGRGGLIAKFVNGVLGISWAAPSPYTATGAVVVLALSTYPVVAAFTAVGIRRLDARHEEALLLLRPSWRGLTTIILPLLSPGIATGALVVFLLVLVDYTTPSLLQVPVYSVEIFTRFSAFRDYSGGILLSVPLLLVGGAAVSLWWVYMRTRRGRLTGMHTRDKMHLDPLIARRPLILVTSLILAVSAALPLSTLFLRSLPLRTYVDVWETAQDEMRTSIIVATLVATFVVALGTALAYLVHRRRSALIVFPLCSVPYLLSGPAWGIAMILFWNHADPRALVYDHTSIVILAVAGRYLLVGAFGMAIAFAQIERPLLEAAEVYGLRWWRELVFIRLPLVAPWALLVWGFTFMLAVGEADASLFLMPPGVTTLSSRVVGLMHYGPSSLVAALSLVSAFLALAGVACGAYAYRYAARKVFTGARS